MPGDGADSRGFTLVEILVALAVGTLVVLVVFSVYHATSSSIMAVESGRRSSRDAATAIDLVGRDLACAIDLPFAGSVSFMLDPGMPGAMPSPSLFFHTVEVSTPDEASVVFKAFRVSYAVKPSDEDAPGSPCVLARESQRIMEDGTLCAAEVREIVHDVAGLAISVSDGRKWLDKWPVEGGGSMPSGARIGLSYRTGNSVRTLESSVIIPAGMKFAPPPAPAAGPGARR